MAIFLIDYENISIAKGLLGLELLNSSDTLEIFYSQICPSIRTDQMEQIKRSGCKFRSFCLKNKGKNALDFYIASRCGMHFENESDRNIVIVSQDKGFDSVKEFFELDNIKKADKVRVHRTESIENGILCLAGDDEKSRKNIVSHGKKYVSIAEETAKYNEREKIRAFIFETLSGTEFEPETENVISFVESQKGKRRKDVYSGSMHRFGLVRGRNIYGLIRDAI